MTEFLRIWAAVAVLFVLLFLIGFLIHALGPSGVGVLAASPWWVQMAMKIAGASFVIAALIYGSNL